MSRLSHATFAQMFGGDIETLVLEFLWYTDMASLALTSRDAVHSKERLKRLQESTRLILELRHEIHRAFFPKVNKYTVLKEMSKDPNLVLWWILHTANIDLHREPCKDFSTCHFLFYATEREVALEAVKKNGYALQGVSRELCDDLEVVLTAVSKNGWALRFASTELRADREVVLASVAKDGWALKYASAKLRADREVVLAAVAQDGCALQYASDELSADREAVLAVVAQDGDAEAGKVDAEHTRDLQSEETLLQLLTHRILGRHNRLELGLGRVRNVGQRLIGAPAQPCQDPNRQSQQAKESQATGDSPVEKQLGDIPLRAALPSHLRRQPLRVGLKPLLQIWIGDLRDVQQPRESVRAPLGP